MRRVFALEDLVMGASTWLTAAAVVAMVAGMAAPASAGDWWYNKHAMEIRIGPGIAYKKVVLVPKRQRLQVYECTAWCDVSWGPYHGYVDTKYIIDLVHLGDPYNITPKHHLPYVTPRVAEHLTVAPITRSGEGPLSPVYVPPATAYLTSQVIAPWNGYDAKPIGRIWYYQNRWYDRPDYFYDIRE
jgi:uncharacterized protein YraI